MEEGFYWVMYAGQKLVAYYAKEQTRHHSSGAVINGVWHFAVTSHLVAITEEVIVLEGPLQPPA